MEHLPGYLIAAAGVLAAVFWIGLRVFQWRRRWGVDPSNGILVRTSNVRHELIDWIDLNRAIEAVGWALGEEFLKDAEAIQWRLEIVPSGGIFTPSVPGGRLRDGTGVGGSIRSERCLPLTKKHLVAVVTSNRPGDYMIHEVVRHIAAEILWGNRDAGHTSERLHQTEIRARVALGRLRTG